MLGHAVFSSPRYLTQTLNQRLVIAGQKAGHPCPKTRLLGEETQLGRPIPKSSIAAVRASIAAALKK
jgi:hypothetical protein